MDIFNRTAIDEKRMRDIAQHSGVDGEPFLLFLDDKVNSVLADFARSKLEEYRLENCQYNCPAWEQEATGESDIHACTVSRRIIASQKLPAHVIDIIGAYELLVYLDATVTGGPDMTFVLTLAHELRHVWQYFNAPVVFYSQTPLSWVIAPQLTPCELDSEKAAKRVLGQMYGDAAVSAYLDVELAACKQEHFETTQRLAALDPAADPHTEANTIALLEEHAEEIRKVRRGNNFDMPGISELMYALRGRSTVRLDRETTI